jgi:hypothetical protein
MQSAAHCVPDNTSAKASTTMSRPLDNTVPLRFIIAFPSQGLYVIGAKDFELVCTRALASRRRHLLRREKRRYLMTQIAGRLIEGADLNLKDEKYKSHPWDGRSTAGATLQPGTTAGSAKWSCSWFLAERELSPSGWSPRACARIR